ncbi:MAG: H-NS histone family protein [Alphaproteobacteria bacterium]|jgi:DNA-binding protein H-NS|nr:H-NS histone family protein [Alphaproteobacteria bacterium]
MKIDVDKMSREELNDLRARVDAALETLAEREREAAFREAEEVAKKHGYSLNDLVGPAGRRGRARGGKASGAKNPPKFRNPENPKQTWSGRGRKPQWIKDAEAEGKLDKMRI